jgi:hypothetical protein
MFRYVSLCCLQWRGHRRPTPRAVSLDKPLQVKEKTTPSAYVKGLSNQSKTHLQKRVWIGLDKNDGSANKLKV